MAKKRLEEKHHPGHNCEMIAVEGKLGEWNELSASPFDSYDLTPQERRAAEAALPAGCSVLSVGLRSPGFIELILEGP